MRRMLWVLFVSLLLISCNAGVEYFPDQILAPDRKDLHEFMAEWFSRHLTAMREPSVWEMSKEGVEGYRFLWLRTFHEPIAIRLNVATESSGELTVKMTDGAGGYEPGNLTVSKTVKLDAEEVSAIQYLIAHNEFWNLPTETGRLGLDGARWIIEGSKDNKYHVVHRLSPGAGPVRNIGNYLYSISGLEVADIY